MQNKDASVAAGASGFCHKLATPSRESQRLVFDSVEGFPIDMDRANSFRADLEAERKAFVRKNCEDFERLTI